MSSGFLRVQSFTSRLAAPLGYVDITVTGSGFSHSFTTDGLGQAPDIEISAPGKCLSLSQSETALPYSVCSIQASKPDWQGLVLEGVQIFDGQVTLAELEMLPSRSDLVETVDIPEHSLYAGTGGSGPAPEESDTAPAILTQVVIPDKITVHLGRPAASAQNVTVSFREYIANVASSEVYPTWAGSPFSGPVLPGAAPAPCGSPPRSRCPRGYEPPRSRLLWAGAASFWSYS